MLKNRKILYVFILSILLSSCGFKKIDQNTNTVYLQDIDVVGQDRISYVLKNNISLISNENGSKKYDVKVNIINKKRIKIKDKAGRVKRYSLNFTTNLTLIDLDTQREITRTFLNSADYDVNTSQSKTISSEKSASNGIVEKISEEIKNFIKLSVENK